MTFIDPMTGVPWVFPGVTYTMIGLSSARYVDFPNPGNGSGFANIGNSVVSATTLNTVTWNTVGTANSPVVFAQMGTGAGWSHAYFLADSDAAPPGSPPGAVDTYAVPVYLQETFTVHYDPPDPNTSVIPAGGAALNTGPGLAGGVPVGGLSVGTGTVGQTLTPAAVISGGVAIPVTPDPILGSYFSSFVNPGSGVAVTVTGTPTDIRVVESFPIASLPYTTTDGVVAGPPWYATAGAGLGFASASNVNDPAGMSDLTTSYSASFSNFPVTTISTIPVLPPPPTITPPPPPPPPPPMIPPP